MATSGKTQVKIILILALVLFSYVANGEISHRIGVSSRRSLANKDKENDNDEAPMTDTLKAKDSGKDKDEAPASNKKKDEDDDEAPSSDKKKDNDNDEAPAAGKGKNKDGKGKNKNKEGPSSREVPSGNGPVANMPPATSTDDSGATVFDVTKQGAKAGGKFDNAQAFILTWKAACNSGSPAKILIPAGIFMTSPVIFEGPCKSKQPIIMEVIGTVAASTDLSDYPSKEWISFEHVDGLVLKGKGTFDGKGESAWQYNNCKKSNYKSCNGLPSNIKFMFVTNGVVSGITSLNSKYFHFHITDSAQISVSGITITAPDESPNTDGIHVSNTKVISITDSIIGTGDDCVSVGQCVTKLSVTKVVCGPGHGISIGSLGKYKAEEDVSDIVVSNCTLRGTTNGARIKTYGGSDPSLASNIVFQDITMDKVKNPIIIDQHYGNNAGSPSRVKVSNVQFKNIQGTSISDVAVSFLCSSSVPCDQVSLTNINLSYVGDKKAPNGITSECENAKVKIVGTPAPLACSRKPTKKD